MACVYSHRKSGKEDFIFAQPALNQEADEGNSASSRQEFLNVF
jgi:hypothetical protein